MKTITYKPIGIIRTPFKEPTGTPIQASGGCGVKGTVEIFPEYLEGLKDLEDFSHIILIYHFHMSKIAQLLVKPFLDEKQHGIFAIRGPSRPNPIGLSVVRLEKIEQNVLHIQDIDIVDETPLLDVKPYVPAFDQREGSKIGWLKEKLDKLPHSRDNGRFSSS